MTETLSPAVWNVLLNIPIFIAGWLFVGRRFVLLQPVRAGRGLPWPRNIGT